MKNPLVFSAALACALLVAGCESEAQREARVRAVLDARLPELEVCAQLYEQLDGAFAQLDAAVEAQNNTGFARANTAMEESKSAFFDCMDDWNESSLQALEEAGLSGAESAAAADAWTAEQWSRLGFEQLSGDGG